MKNGPIVIDHGEGENITTKKKAIVIGVSDYSTNLQSLNFCKNEGKELSELLTSLGYEILDSHRLISQVSYLMSSYHIPNVLFRYSDTAVF